MAKLARLFSYIALALASTAYAEPIKIRTGYVSAPNIITPFVFEKREILKHYGKSYVTEPARFKTTALELTALPLGELQVASMGFTALGPAILNAKMNNIRVIADGIRDGVEGYYSTQYMVLKNSSIKSASDLKGKVVSGLAPGTAVDLPMRVMLRKHGLEANKDYTSINVGFANMQSMLSEGKIALASSTLPWGILPKTLEESRTLFTARDAVGETQLIVMVAREDFIKENRAALVDFLEDYIRGLRWFSDPKNREEAIGIVARFMKREPEAFSYLFTKEDFYRDPAAKPNLEVLQKNIDTQHELGFLKETIDVQKYADVSLVEEAAKRANEK